MLKEYDGYEWGWILSDGKRESNGTVGTGVPSNIIGVWGMVYRKDIANPFYRETFLGEYRNENPTKKDSWSKRPLAMLLTLNMAQCLKFAYPEDKPIADEMVALPEEVVAKTKILQLWECKECGHTFYTPAGPKQAIHLALSQGVRRLVSLKPLRIECEVCSKIAAKKVKKVSKEQRQ